MYVAIFALILSLILGIFGYRKDDLTYSQIVDLFRNEQVKSFVVEEQTITLELHHKYDGKDVLTCKLADPESFRQEMLSVFKTQSENGVLESYDFVPEEGFSPYDLIFPLLIVGIVILILWAALMSRANGGNQMSNFGRARTVMGVPDGKKVTFDDVAGVDEEKAELQEIVDFLRSELFGDGFLHRLERQHGGRLVFPVAGKPGLARLPDFLVLVEMGDESVGTLEAEILRLPGESGEPRLFLAEDISLGNRGQRLARNDDSGGGGERLLTFAHLVLFIHVEHARGHPVGHADTRGEKHLIIIAEIGPLVAKPFSLAAATCDNQRDCGNTQ
jgi:hypothetical protein